MSINTTITALPTPPSRNDSPSDFASKADSFLGAFPQLRTDLNGYAVDFNNTAAVISDNIANVNTIADDLNSASSEITTVYSNITNVNNVGSNITDVTTVVNNLTDIGAVSDNMSNVQSVAAIDTKVTVVANNITDVTSVGDTTIAKNAYQDALALSNNGIEQAVIFGA